MYNKIAAKGNGNENPMSYYQLKKLCSNDHK